MNAATQQLIDPSLLLRKIIHIDMDAFYAAVEVRDHPELKGLPVIVGGSPNGRGVVATCSYEARRFGIHSAMPSAIAIRRCPHAVFVRPRFEAYLAASKQIRQIFQRYATLIQPLSLDEAFLDVTHNPQFLSATEIARQIRSAIASELMLTASAGVAPNKMLAKIASEVHKPDGLTIIKPEQAGAFMWNLPVRKIPGIGPKTAERLSQSGIVFCRDVLSMNQHTLLEKCGNIGLWLVKRSRGLDDRPVSSGGPRKSIGKERTFGRDLETRADLLLNLKDLAERIERSLREKSTRGKTITLKVRYRGFETVTRSKTMPLPVDSSAELYAVSLSLLAKTEAVQRPVRLLGISVSNLEGRNTSMQLSLF